MFVRKTWLLRFSIFLNVVVLLLYVGPHIASKNGVDFIEELQASGRNLAQIAPESASLMSANTEGPASGPVSGPAVSSSVSVSSQRNTQPETVSNRVVPEDVVAEQSTKKPKVTTTSTPQSLLENSVASFPSTSENNQEVRSIEEVIKCNDKTVEPRTAQRSDFWVLYNYVPAKRKYRCFETITYTTHADYTFLDNLKPLLERWQGPVSLAMHAPGTDFKPTLAAIRYARDCLSPLVEEFVTFHVFFGTRHVPREVPRSERAVLERANCSLPAPWFNVSASSLYKAKNRILYPVNVGRNIARESAVTYYILPSDIELYPSPGVIPAFLEMVRRQDPPLLRPGPKVFPLSIFELEKGMPLPENKTQLVNMLKNGTAILFHKKLCPECHNVPKSKEWMAANVTEGLHIFHIGKRMGYHIHWEPIFIGTHHDPLYDERLSWEGKRDKMTQGYVLCFLDYEFQILDNAFLVHKPGIKTLKNDPLRAMLAGKTNALIKKVIFPELKVLYGIKKGCAV
ncbi:beta-1,4-glucuronyltransferase 1-like [Anabrus simplex]|uniref:beta-1,4-glucuronyltransferase 1-like n=1 Tax=Anabrus simplex TaxID=316456 RepID=UPI0035A31833